MDADVMRGRIEEVCEGLAGFLIGKNEAYGNSVGDPVRICSQADALERVRVRIDDKLSRFARGGTYEGDNDVLDLAGYFVLWLALVGWASPGAAGDTDGDGPAREVTQDNAGAMSDTAMRLIRTKVDAGDKKMLATPALAMSIVSCERTRGGMGHEV